MNKLLGAATLALVLAWLGLFLSNHALLVWSTTNEEGIAKTLVCRYFTGTDIVKREFLKGKLLGRDACPRWISLAER